MKLTLGVLLLVFAAVCEAQTIRVGSFRTDCEGMAAFDPSGKYRCEGNLQRGAPDILTIDRTLEGDWVAKYSLVPPEMVVKGKSSPIDGRNCVEFYEGNNSLMAVCAAPPGELAFPSFDKMFRSKTGLFITVGFAHVDLIEVFKK